MIDKGNNKVEIFKFKQELAYGYVILIRNNFALLPYSGI